MSQQLDSDLIVLVGVALPTDDDRAPGLTNSIALVDRQGWRAVAHKQLLPSYDVFDERRYFRPGTGPNLLQLPNGQRLGLTICEDLWVDDNLQRERLAGPDPIEQLISEQPDVVINLAASPFDADKPLLRQKLAATGSAPLELSSGVSQSSRRQRRIGLRWRQFCDVCLRRSPTGTPMLLRPGQSLGQRSQARQSRSRP
jgi:NAD+ synthase/NAD+ synthase (glutamine-hydrolysing)